MASWSAWAAASRCRLTSGWCAPPTLTCRRWSRKVGLAPTCSTAWPSTWYSSPAARPAESIMLLANQFAIQMCRELGLPLFPSARRRTSDRDAARPSLAGNIRELKNVVERSVYRHGDSEHELDAIIINPFRQSPALRRKPRPAMSCPRYHGSARFPASAGKTPAAAESGEQAKKSSGRRRSCWD